MSRLERLIGAVLRGGVLMSSLCLAAGLGLALTASAGWLVNLLLQIGLVVLLVTPVVRVIVSTIEYAVAGDWTFATLTLIVLVELIASAAAATLFNRRI